MHRVLLVLVAGCGRIDFDAVGATYRDAVEADRPIAYWRLDDTDSTARDEIGGHPGVYSGDCVQGAAGALASDRSVAVHFGAGICRIDLPELSLNGRAEFSVEAWANLERLNDFQVYFMNETRSAGYPLDGYAMLSTPVGVYLERSMQGFVYQSQPYVATVGVFTHYVGTYDGTQLHMFIDGAEFGAPGPDNLVIDSTGATAVIGAYPPGFGTPHIEGVLDEIAVYDRVLAPDRIALHHEIGRNGPR